MLGSTILTKDHVVTVVMQLKVRSHLRCYTQKGHFWHLETSKKSVTNVPKWAATLIFAVTMCFCMSKTMVRPKNSKIDFSNIFKTKHMWKWALKPLFWVAFFRRLNIKAVESVRGGLKRVWNLHKRTLCEKIIDESSNSFMIIRLWKALWVDSNEGPQANGVI